MIILSPIWSAVLLWWLVGVSLVVLGAIQIGRALTLKKSVEALPAA
ncbi:hypothetical protein GCM10010401_21680 [Rarobacter faecitabidus]|uniref:Uncharacterized protein n=1 Tax=Rarobacter faecitabidus TaxID=13243 RepID=A0A542ZVJ9_RARFA|nr:hypothetical protein [Rarobacter faecitabidus]TQL64372.1 hypothetical protein FB461_0874 [Rarobacter faecitabidus]